MFTDDREPWANISTTTAVLGSVKEITCQKYIMSNMATAISKSSAKTISTVSSNTRVEYIHTPQMTLQPNTEEVLILRSYYSSLSASSSYKRRMSWLEGNTFRTMVIEYTGVHPGNNAHGNATMSTAAYRKTSIATMEYIKSRTGIHTPKRVYADLITNSRDPNDLPRNAQQIRNTMKRIRQNAAPVQPMHKANLADKIIVALNLLRTDEFVQSVIGSKDVPPQIILHFSDQIEMIRKFCFTAETRTVLTFDMTFNLSPGMYVTTAVFKHPFLLNRRTNEEPVILGPIFLHGRLTTEVFATFLSHIAIQVRDCNITDLIVGSDDDKALKSALSLSFPHSRQLTCTRHIKNNVIRHLTDKCGVSEKQRKGIVTNIFGRNGICRQTGTAQLNQQVN